MMNERYPHCAACKKPLGVRVGLRKGDLRFCNLDCERSYYAPPEGEATQAGAVLYGALEILRTENPGLSEKSLLALHYLGWDRTPPKNSKDYRIFKKVRGWIK